MTGPEADAGLAQSPRRAGREPTLALINVVFLMLVFFLVAGRLAPAPEPGLRLVQTALAEARAPSGAVVLHADGRIALNGQDWPDLGQALAQLSPDARQNLRLMPDRALPAARLVAAAAQARAAGADRVLIVTERGLTR